MGVNTLTRLSHRSAGSCRHRHLPHGSGWGLLPPQGSQVGSLSSSSERGNRHLRG